MICLDASVAVKLILIEERSDLARTLYQDALLTRRPIIAPLLLRLEVTNFLRQRMHAQGGLSLAEGTRHLDDFLALPVDYRDPPGLHLRALALADAYGLPATYDAHYLALAEEFGCEFWTDDLRLLCQVGGRLPYVRPLVEYAG